MKTLLALGRILKDLEKNNFEYFVFGRRLRMKLPEVSSSFPISRYKHNNAMDRLQPLQIGDLIWMQGQDGKWPFKGHIVNIDDCGCTYRVKLSDSRNFIQNRHFLRKRYA